MFLLHLLQLFCIGLIIWRTGAQVTLAPENATDNFRCGDSEVLVCSINPYVNLMSWTKNTTVAQLASCTLLSCTTNPSFAPEYSFTFNESNGIFEMTIIKVTLTDQGTTYFCDNGLDSDSVTVDVEVNEDLNVTLSDQQIDPNTTEIRATTGCIKNITAQNVEWVWWLQEENDTTDGKHYLDNFGSKVYDDSTCKADTDCWIDGFTEITLVLNITEEETEKRYYVGINVTFGSNYSDSFELDTNKTFMLNLPIQEREPSPPSPPPCSCTNGIIIAYFVIWIVQLQMCIYGCSQCSSYLEHGLMRWFKLLQLLTHCPCFGFIPAICIYISLEKSNRRNIPWLLLFASAPLLGIFVKIALLALHKIKWKSDHPDLKYIICFAVVVVVSIILEICVILLCTVWCISQWYSLIIALYDLMSRWVLFIILAIVYQENIVPKNCRDTSREDVSDSNTNREKASDSNTYRENVSDSNTNRKKVPSLLAFEIALWCTPIIGIIFNICCTCTGQTGHRVAPKQTNRGTPYQMRISPRNNKKTSQKKDIEAPNQTKGGAPNQTRISPRNNRDTSQKKDIQPRALQRIPRVTSRHILQENTEIRPKVPPIKSA